MVYGVETDHSIASRDLMIDKRLLTYVLIVNNVIIIYMKYTLWAPRCVVRYEQTCESRLTMPISR